MKTSALISAGFAACFFGISFFPQPAEAQLPRERTVTDLPVDNVFWATTNVGISTVHSINARDLNTSVAHTFGLVRRGINHLYGLDDGANTRIGLDYGVTGNFSAGLGRMTFNKVVDIRGKYHILKQTTTGSMPVSLGIKASTGISTISGLEFQDRLSYFGSLMIARKFNGFSSQLSPMLSYFNSPAGSNPNQLIGLGVLSNYVISDRYSVSAEYLPVIGNRNDGTSDAMAVALNIDTGGHVFQIFLTSSQWHNEPFIMANNRDRFWEGDLRLGFNIHRVFGLGGR